MRRLLSLAGRFLLVAAFTLPGRLPARPATPADSSNSEVNVMSTEFAVDLYHKLREGGGNVFFSPWSIDLALTMTWAGARGTTADEIAKVLHLPGGPDVVAKLVQLTAKLKAEASAGGFQFRSANALWNATRFPFVSEYLAQMENTLGAHLAELDFAADPTGARQTINAWIAGQTHDKIKDLLGPGNITPETRLVLANAIFFKAAWENSFKKDRTQNEAFFVSPDQKTSVPLMYQQRSFSYAEDSTVQVVDLPYRHHLLAMRIFLPRSGDGLDKLESDLSAQRMKALEDGMRRQVLQVWLPRFKLENKYSLVETLSALGIKRAFNQADFGGISTVEGLSISDVVHQAFVDTNEEGTEAAAATAVEMRGGIALPESGSKIFRADHPFLFAIIHQPTGSILFMGRVSRPQ
jgi:serpin B